MTKMHIKTLTLVLTTFILLSAAYTVLGVPQIISWGNSKTNNDSRSFTVNIAENVRFNVTLNENVTQWGWLVDGNPGNSNTDNFSYQFMNSGSHTVEVSASNGSQVSNTITWNISVNAPPRIPEIMDWSNNKTNSRTTDFTINASDSVRFNATADQKIDMWRWFVGGLDQNNNSDTFTNNFGLIGTYEIKVDAKNNTNGTSNPVIWNVSVIDTTPPSNVTNLRVASTADIGQTYINWAWVNPAKDFKGNRIFIDGIFEQDLLNSLNNYNASGLAPGTSHKITVIAFDFAGNNATPVEDINTTLPNTLEGNNIIPVGLPSGVNISFFNVAAKGNTTISFAPTYQPAPGFSPLGKYNFISINTSATFTGPVTISLNYDSPPAGYIQSNVRLYYLNGTVWQNVTTNLDTTNKIVTGVITGQPPFVLVAGIYPPPRIDVIELPPSFEVTVKDELFFDISVNQDANVTWKYDNTSQGPSLIQAGGRSNFTFPRNTVGNYTISVEAGNLNGTSVESWNVTVHPRFFFKGNRIWDGSRPDEFSLTYTWDPMRFSGFYYDINDDVGDESITINLDGYADRTINQDDLVYTTSPQEVSFGYSGFGKYEVIGFMAEKYFAGYSSSTTPPGPSTGFGRISTLAQGQLHKVLVDDDTRRTVSLGTTLTLKEGYVLKAVDIDPGARTMLISLLKDGNEVEKTPLSAGQTYIYTRRVGAVSDLPLIMVRFDSVFSGAEVQAAFIRGMFQISEGYASVDTGNKFGKMEVSSVSGNRIEMRNDASISLSEGSTQDLMGDIKIIVADNDAVRFALSVEKTQGFEVRSSIYREDDTIEEWTPYNFGMNIGKTSIGFYYDLDEGIGNEELRLAEPLDGGRTIKNGNLIYTASPQEVSFGYSGFGKYEVIGFMADKYFAGYGSGSQPPDPTTPIGTISTLAQGQLHRVLIDDDTSRTISLGSTLTLKEGYVLKAVDIDPGARTMLISLLKDGNEIDTAAVSAGRTYVYTKKVGTVSDLPILMVRLDSVFSGREMSAAFLKGIFQISEVYATVDTGNRFGEMEVQSVGNDKIEMSNDGSISLGKGKNDILMGNLRLKVGDTTDNTLRFYFAVDVTPDMVENLLVIDAPAQANAGEVIEIKVTAGGNPVDGASIELDSSEIGQTDINGSFNYDLPRSLKGIHNITATKLGYIKDIKDIEILEYIERRLSIDSPAMANQFETITIRVTSNGTAISGAAVRYDNTTIGSTDVNGTMNYTLETSGTHTISASRAGYITVVKEIEVRAPYSEYKALDINITPNVIFANQQAIIRSNITNAGTKKDTLPVELIINGTAVDNRSVSLAPGEIKEINFTRKEVKAGNYSVEILGQEGLLQVKEAVFNLNLILIVLIITGLGAIAVYLYTSKISLESIRQKLKFGKE